MWQELLRKLEKRGWPQWILWILTTAFYIVAVIFTVIANQTVERAYFEYFERMKPLASPTLEYGIDIRIPITAVYHISRLSIRNTGTVAETDISIRIAGNNFVVDNYLIDSTELVTNQELSEDKKSLKLAFKKLVPGDLILLTIVTEQAPISPNNISITGAHGKAVYHDIFDFFKEYNEAVNRSNNILLKAKYEMIIATVMAGIALIMVLFRLFVDFRIRHLQLSIKSKREKT